MSAEPDTLYRWHPGVATRTLEGTAFILLGSRMLSLNSVGTHIWERFEAGATIPDVARSVVTHFETTEDVALVDAARFVQDLLSRQLLVPQPRGDGPGPVAPSSV